MLQETKVGRRNLHIPSWWMDFDNPSQSAWEARHLKAFIDRNCAIFQNLDTNAAADQIKKEVERVTAVATHLPGTTTSLKERLTILACQQAFEGEVEMVEVLSHLPQADLSIKDTQVILGVAHLIKAIRRSGVVKSSVDQEMHTQMDLAALYFVNAVST